MQPGTEQNVLRVAIIGSGPSAFYAAAAYFKTTDLRVSIDVFDRLPTPFGLVRGGVAPDHQKIKSVTRVFEKIAAHPNFRFYGNVEFGRDLKYDDMLQFYHQIFFAVGAGADRSLNIPGEELSGSHSATEFVAWYNGHPYYRGRKFDLSCERAVVVGMGNVAIDIARILAKNRDELAGTDIAEYALEQLAESKITEIVLLARRGPAQAAFTNPEIKELGELADAGISVPANEVELDSLSAERLRSHPDPGVASNLETLKSYVGRSFVGKSKRILIRFLRSPVEILGDTRVKGVRLVKNKLEKSSDDSLRPIPTDVFETLDTGIVFRSVGYRGVELPGIPFDKSRGIMPNIQGRVVDPATNRAVDGLYCTGWIKRGPSGVIGTNKPDAQETVSSALEDLRQEKMNRPSLPDREAVTNLLMERGIRFVTFDDWRKIDTLESERGKPYGRPRIKFTSISEMLEAAGK